MAIDHNATLEALTTAVQTNFAKALADTPNDFATIATKINSSTASNTYAWLGQFPHMREWVGKRVLQNAKEYAYQVTNNKYESTLEIKRTDLEDNNIGHYGVLGTQQGQEVIRHANRLVFAQLAAGFSGTCFDGQNFFDTDHPVNDKTDSSGTDVSVSNIITGSATPWYLLSTQGALKPIIYQERVKAEITNKTAAKNSDHVFMTDNYLMGVRWRGAAGFGLWQTAIGAQVDLTEDAFNNAYQMMLSFKGHGGDPLGVVPDTLVVPPSLQAHAHKLIKAREINGSSNINFERVNLIVTPWLA